MAKVIIGGQMLSLLLALLVTPVTYSLFDSLGGLLRRGRSWLQAPVANGVPIRVEEVTAPPSQRIRQTSTGAR
jgi:hypothetical protein